MHIAKSVGEAERVQVLKRDGKRGEEGPDLIPNAVPRSFTAEEAIEFRKELELHPCWEESSLLEKTWRLKEALKTKEMISDGWQGEGSNDVAFTI